jgi:inner membrane protein
MDSITHLALGACTGELLLGKKLGKKALLWGALLQNLPDCDTFVSEFYSADKSFLIHRGITHSLFFAALAGIGLALLIGRIHRKEKLPIGLLIFFCYFQISLHDLLDTCNAYGTGLLEPFSHHRFAINLLYVADPLFTISMIVAALWLMFKGHSIPAREKWAWRGIGIAALYLCVASFNKLYINYRINESLHRQKISVDNYFTTPAPFNSLLWFVVAAKDSSYTTAYTSVFDDFKRPVNYSFYPQNKLLAGSKVNPELLNNLVVFADGYYTISQSGGSLYFNVLRFQQVQGWLGRQAPFAFSYPLTSGNADGMILQRGRMIGWNKKTLAQYIGRIFGTQYFTSP